MLIIDLYVSTKHGKKIIRNSKVCWKCKYQRKTSNLSEENISWIITWWFID